MILLNLRKLYSCSRYRGRSGTAIYRSGNRTGRTLTLELRPALGKHKKLNLEVKARRIDMEEMAHSELIFDGILLVSRRQNDISGV